MLTTKRFRRSMMVAALPLLLALPLAADRDDQSEKVKARLEWMRHSYTRLILPMLGNDRRVGYLLVCINSRELPELREAD